MLEHRLIVGVRRTLELALLVLVVLVLATVVLGRIVPLTGRQTLVVGGRSMEPAIPLGSAVVTTPIAPSDLASGQIVSMRIGPAATVFSHRITRVIDRDGAIWVETKGDANPDVDPAITPASSIIGRVDWTLPVFGYLITLLSLPIGLVFVLGLGGTLLVASLLLDDLESDTVTIVVGHARGPWDSLPSVEASRAGARDGAAGHVPTG